ncbi:DUF1441 family protein [Methylomagnum sp.]
MADDIKALNKAQIAEIFGVSLPAVEGWIRRGCPVAKRGGKGAVYEFDLLAVAQWRFGGAGEPKEGGEVDPERMTAKERKDWYEGERVRRALEVDAGKLVQADDVEIELGSLIKAFAGFLETLPFTLERECGLSADVVERLQIATDEQRQAFYERMTK